MSTVEIITIIVSSIGGSAILFAALAWLTKSVINHFLSKDIEKFKRELQKSAFEHQIRFSQLHERRANIIADIYGRLYEFYWAACAFLKHYPSSDNTKKSTLLMKLTEHAEGFKDFFDKHRIYFTEEICSQIDELVKSLDEASIPLGLVVEGFDKGTEQDVLEVWRKGADIMMKKVPEIKSSLEINFRQILGVIQSEKEGTK